MKRILGVCMLLGLLLGSIAIGAPNPKLDEAASMQMLLHDLMPTASYTEIVAGDNSWNTVDFGFLTSSISVFAEDVGCSVRFAHDTDLYTLSAADTLYFPSGRDSTWRVTPNVMWVPAGKTLSGPFRATSIELKQASDDAQVFGWGSPLSGGP